MKVIVAGGGWSTNIGNSFFNMGTLYVLQKVMPNAEVFLFSDQPANLDFLRRRSPKNSLNIFNYIESDYLVLHGSVLTRYLPRIWGASLRRAQDKGIKIIFISSGLFEYSQSEIETVKRFFEKTPPFLFVSRDSETYRHFCCFAEHSYDGIDSAFFLPEVYTPLRIGLPPYIILNFDKSPEPFISCPANNNIAPVRSEQQRNGYLSVFEFNSKKWVVTFPYFRYRISKRLSKYYVYFESLLSMTERRPNSVDDYKIVRTDHQFNPVILRKLYRHPNSFCWDIPYPYICLYANTALTLTDRVHAAVVTLAYGKPAMLFSESNRSRILKRVGVKGLHAKPTHLDQELLGNEKENMLEFLRKLAL